MWKIKLCHIRISKITGRNHKQSHIFQDIQNCICLIPCSKNKHLLMFFKCKKGLFLPRRRFGGIALQFEGKHHRIVSLHTTSGFGGNNRTGNICKLSVGKFKCVIIINYRNSDCYGAKRTTNTQIRWYWPQFTSCNMVWQMHEKPFSPVNMFNSDLTMFHRYIFLVLKPMTLGQMQRCKICSMATPQSPRLKTRPERATLKNVDGHVIRFVKQPLDNEQIHGCIVVKHPPSN